MNINPTVGAQPSFQAKFKDNEDFRKYVKSVNREGKYENYSMYMKRLEKISQGDVLEIYHKDSPSRVNEGSVDRTYFVRNPKKKNSDIRLESGWKEYSPVGGCLVDFLEKVTRPKTYETNTILTEPATKDQRTLTEKFRDWMGDTEKKSDVMDYAY